MASQAASTNAPRIRSLIAIAAGLLLLGPALQAAASGPQAWEQTDKLVPQESGQFGDAVAIDGDTLLVGAPREGDVGAAYVYSRVPTAIGNRRT